MDQTRNTENPDRDRNRPDQGVPSEGKRDERNIGQERKPGSDRDLNDVNVDRNKNQGNQGDRSSGAGGSQTNR
jgi:hypothetical protein